MPTPPNIGTLVAWYQNGTGITTGSTFTWADQSGNNYNASQSTSGKQPTVNAGDGQYNSRTTLSFASASSQYLEYSTGFSLTQPFTLMVIGNNDGTSAGQIFCGHQTSPAILYSTSTTAVKYSAGSGISYTVSAGYMATPRIYVVVFNGASSALYINTGTAVSTGNAGANNPSGAFFLGSDVSTSNFLNGKLMEVAIWSGTPSVVQIIQYGQSLLFSSVLMDSMDFRRKSNSRAQLVRPRDVRRIRPLTSGYVSSLSSAGLFR